MKAVTLVCCIALASVAFPSNAFVIEKVFSATDEWGTLEVALRRAIPQAQTKAFREGYSHCRLIRYVHWRPAGFVQVTVFLRCRANIRG